MISFIFSNLVSVVFAALTFAFAIVACKKSDNKSSGLVAIFAALSTFIAIIFNIKPPMPVIYPLNSAIQVSVDNVEVKIDSSGFSVFYTLDGSDPRNGVKYEEPFLISGSTTISARNKFLFWWSDLEDASYFFEDKIVTTESNAIDTNNEKEFIGVSAQISDVEELENPNGECNVENDASKVYSIDDEAEKEITNSVNPVIEEETTYNEIILKYIQDNYPEEHVVSYNIDEIYGNNKISIIVSTSNCGYIDYEDISFNRLAILNLDGNNKINIVRTLLGQNDGFESTFSITLSDDSRKLIPETEYIFDFIGDEVKELIVKYYTFNSNDAFNGTAIFMCSNNNSEYELIGTYPESVKEDLHIYNNSNRIVGTRSIIVPTRLKDNMMDEYEVIRCFDGEKYYNLNESNWNSREYWIETANSECLLATVNLDEDVNNTTFINIYKPIFDDVKKDLSWELLYSEYVNDFPIDYSKDNLISAIVEIMKCYVSLVEQSNEFGYWTPY